MKSLNQMKLEKQDNFPEEIIIHHTGGTASNPLADTSHHTFETIQNWHVYGRGWENIGYHYVIEKDGKVKEGRPETYHGAHCVGMNNKSIGICLTGNHSLHPLSEAQNDSLRALIKKVRATYLDIKVKPHRAYSSKNCPGLKITDKWIECLNDIKNDKRNLADYSTMELLRELWRRISEETK